MGPAPSCPVSASCLAGSVSYLCYALPPGEGAGPSPDDSGPLTPCTDVSGNGGLGPQDLLAGCLSPRPARGLAPARASRDPSVDEVWLGEEAPGPDKPLPHAAPFLRSALSGAGTSPASLGFEDSF